HRQFQQSSQAFLRACVESRKGLVNTPPRRVPRDWGPPTGRLGGRLGTGPGSAPRRRWRARQRRSGGGIPHSPPFFSLPNIFSIIPTTTIGTVRRMANRFTDPRSPFRGG